MVVTQMRGPMHNQQHTLLMDLGKLPIPGHLQKQKRQHWKIGKVRPKAKRAKSRMNLMAQVAMRQRPMMSRLQMRVWKARTAQSRLRTSKVERLRTLTPRKRRIELKALLHLQRKWPRLQLQKLQMLRLQRQKPRRKRGKRKRGSTTTSTRIMTMRRTLRRKEPMVPSLRRIWKTWIIQMIRDNPETSEQFRKL